MRRGEVLVAWPSLVEFNDDEAGGQGRSAKYVEEQVGDGTRTLLLRCMCWLEDECGLNGKQKTDGVEKRMCGEEDELLREYSPPNDGGENPYASLCNSCSAYPEVLVQGLSLRLARVASTP